MPTTNKNLSPFEQLNPAIIQWLRSDTVLLIIMELNKKCDAFNDELNVIPQLIVKVSTGVVKPERFAYELDRGLPFLEPKMVEETAETIKERVFKPLKSAFKSYSIDIEKISTSISTEPAVHTMKIERVPAQPRPVAPPPAPAAPRPAAPPPPPQPHARVMEMSHVIDLRKPAAPTPKPVTPTATPAQTGGPAAQTMKIEGDFSAGNQKTSSAGQTVQKNIAANQSKQSVGDAAVLEAAQPFGLAEVAPKAPEKPAAPPPAPVAPKPASPPVEHELAPYHDEHPTKTS